MIPKLFDILSIKGTVCTVGVLEPQTAQKWYCAGLGAAGFKSW